MNTEEERFLKEENYLPVAKPTKFYVAGVKLRQFIYRNSTSYPYISSDALENLCDISYPEQKEKLTEEFIHRLTNSKRVFCQSHLSADMLRNFADEMKAELLIFSNSDFEFHEPITNFPKTIKLVLMENSYISDSLMTFTLPIGIENLRIGMNGMKSLFHKLHKVKKNKLVLVGPFSPTHTIRSGVVKGFVAKTGPWTVINHRMNPKNYAKLASKFGYIACVRGNSVESHRLWESLYRGSTPLVLRDKWAESLAYMLLPIVLIETWEPDEIKRVIESRNREEFNPEDIPALWIPFWEKFIDDKLQS
jgi:hypothetical protein